MSNETLAAKIVSDPAARPIPVILPNNVKENVAGLVFREFVVRLPQDCAFGDLNDPRIWRKVQATGRTSLRRLDRLVILAYDESWMAHAFVKEATATGISITKPVKTEMSDASQKLFETSEYRTHWTGDGYAVVRKSDGATVVDSSATPEEAERRLWALYPKKVA